MIADQYQADRFGQKQTNFRAAGRIRERVVRVRVFPFTLVGVARYAQGEHACQFVSARSAKYTHSVRVLARAQLPNAHLRGGTTGACMTAVPGSLA